MKKRLSLIALFALVGAQLGWLGYNYHAREVEMATAPTLLVECDAFDPRDFFRGDYVSFDCEFTYRLTDPLFRDLFHWDDTQIKRHIEDTAVLFPGRSASNPESIRLTFDRWGTGVEDKLVGFWTVGEDGKSKLTRVVKLGSSGDVTRPGEMRTYLRARVSPQTVAAEYDEAAEKQIGYEVRLRLLPRNMERNWYRFRFYVPENMGDIPRFGQRDKDPYPLHRLRTTVEFACREHGGLMVRQVYINDIPWVQAVRMMHDGSFPLLPEPGKAE
ncbi:MAG: hypothetical protein Q4F40_04995 [Akkermansia sp.]|nr:hypothetical protein [Akkermansia sp.]